MSLHFKGLRKTTFLFDKQRRIHKQTFCLHFDLPAVLAPAARVVCLCFLGHSCHFFPIIGPSIMSFKMGVTWCVTTVLIDLTKHTHALSEYWFAISCRKFIVLLLLTIFRDMLVSYVLLTQLAGKHWILWCLTFSWLVVLLYNYLCTVVFGIESLHNLWFFAHLA